MKPILTLTVLAVLAIAGASSAESLDLVAGHTPVLNHWPAGDAYIGTGDDLVGSDPSPMSNSAPNSIAAMSYNAFDFGTGTTETGYLPPVMNAVTFLQGSLQVDVEALAGGGGPIVTGWSLSGTEPFIGHGAYGSTITAVNSGSYDPVTGNASVNVDFEAVLMGGTTYAESFEFNGTAFYRAAADFGEPTGFTYFDTVLIPLAQALDAGSLFFMIGNGIVPESTGGTGGYFPSMPVLASLVAVGSGASPNTETTWGRVKGLYGN